MTDITLFGAIDIEDYHALRWMIQFFRRRGSIKIYGTQWIGCRSHCQSNHQHLVLCFHAPNNKNFKIRLCYAALTYKI